MKQCLKTTLHLHLEENSSKLQGKTILLRNKIIIHLFYILTKLNTFNNT